MKKIVFSAIFLLSVQAAIFSQNVGVQTATPNTVLDINGDIALRMANLSVTAGINSNLNTTTTKRSSYRVTDATADFTITGITGGSDGRVITLINTTAFVMTLVHESANSIDANRLQLTNGTTYDVLPKATISLQYSITENRWFLTGNSNLEKNAWGVTGNKGTNATVNFIGTTDDVPLSFRQNNKWLGRLNSYSKNYTIGGGAGENFGNLAVDNVAIGDSALTGLANAQNIVAIGSHTARNPNGNSNSVAIGHEAGRMGMNVNSVAIGYQSQRGTVAGSNGSFNTSVGAGSLSANADNGNTAIGYNNLKLNTGKENTAVGYKVFENHKTGDYNTVMGSIALNAHKTGFQNTVLGSNAMVYDTLGSQNVAVGYGTLFVKNNRDGLVAVGHSALRNNGNSATLASEALENTGIGYYALSGNDKGSSNTGLGFNSLSANANGSFNTAIGTKSITGNGNGSNNTAVGYASLFYGGGTHNNTAIGTRAMGGQVPGFSNVAVGIGALYNTSGKSNLVAVGDSALFNNGTSSNALEGIQNTAIGSKALAANFTGSKNTALGFNSLWKNTTGSGNNAVGNAALALNTTGANNIALGESAGGSNTGGNANIAIGNQALQLNTNGGINVAIGHQAANYTTGGGNVAIGANSLGTNSTGNYNTAIGYNANVGNGNYTNATAIGANAVVYASNAMVLGNNAKVGIGTTNPNASLTVNKVSGATSTASLNGSVYESIFSSGTNEDTYITGGKANSKVFLNDIPKGEVLLGAGGLYSANVTAGFNLVPLGIVGYYVTTSNGTNTSAGFNNYAGNLVSSEDHWAEVNIANTSGMGIELRLDSATIRPYRQIIALGGPKFIGSADIYGANTNMAGLSMHFKSGRMTDTGNIFTIDEQFDPINLSYRKLTIEVALEDLTLINYQTLHGTVFFYGIK